MSKWWKGKKLWYAIGTVVLQIAAELFPDIPAEVKKSILTMGIALVTGHTATDIAAMFKAKK